MGRYRVQKTINSCNECNYSRCSDKGDVRVITKSHKEDKCILAPNNFNHHAGEGSKGRKRRLTNKVPAIQASRGGSSQESYVVTKQKKKK